MDRFLARSLALMVFCLPAPLLLAQNTYLRAGVGVAATRSATLLDADCSSVTPPALFGCVDGDDGRPLAARGDFGSSQLLELGAGIEAGTRTRFELALTRYRDIDFDGEANFIGVAGAQPVSASGRSTSLLALGHFSLRPAADRFVPFVVAGAGVARKETGAVTFGFPAIAPDAVTVIRGGRETGFAWTAGAGLSVFASDSASVDFVIRYTDLGELRTEAGAATIIRPARRLTLDIAGTKAELRTIDVLVSLRYRP